MARYINRSRAAVICFGGWGLQTMLHLWPRVRFIQEERRILGIERELPDLNKQTAFACVMPHPLPKSGEDRPLTVVQPANIYPKPYYVEEVLHGFRPSRDASNAELTSSEIWADWLYAEAIKKKYINELPINMPYENVSLESAKRRWRRDMFSAGIAWAEPIAKSLLRHVIDPTRLDNIQTLDPHVQTNIYVVASLAEPLTSALIWPIISELAATLGTRNVARVIAFFSTGSFALDHTASVEEVCSHAALHEIESLTGIRSTGQEELRKQVRGSKGGWGGRVGLPLFDRIYILDKEKANASLASNAHELAVLTGNAIEAFLTADGATHIEMRLGPDIDMQAAQKRYSLLGAANDYVPLADYIDAAIRHEQKRIVQTLVVPRDDTIKVEASLKDLNAEPSKAVKELRSGTTRIFENETEFTIEARRWRRRLVNVWKRKSQPENNDEELSEWLPNLRVKRSYFLSDEIKQLKQTAYPWRWHSTFKERLTKYTQDMEANLKIKRFAQVWGIPYHYSTLEDREELEPSERQEIVDAELKSYTERTWASRWRNEKRIIPYAMFEALHISVNDICKVTDNRADGLLRANERLKIWRDECEKIIEKLGRDAADPEDAEWNQRYGKRFKDFEQRFVSFAGNYPHRSAIWTRSILTGVFITFLLFNWLLFELRLDLTYWQMSLIGIGCLCITALTAGFVEGLGRWRIWRLQQERIALAQERLSRHAEHYVRSNLHRVYRRLGDILGDLQEVVNGTIESLRKWSQSEEKIHILPLGIERSHLRVAHLNDVIWDRVKDHVQHEPSPEEKLSAESLFFRAWSADGKAERLWYEAGQSSDNRLAQRIRLALELPFNQRELGEHIIETKTQRQLPISIPSEARLQSREDIEKELRQSHWCAFKHGDRCSACSTPDTCPLTDKAMDQEGEDASTGALYKIFSEYLERATDYLHPSGAIFPGGSKETIQKIIDEFAIEKLIAGDEGILSKDNILERRRDFVEESAARAKPAGNHELTDPFEDSLVDIEFSVTPEGEKSPLEAIFRDRKIPLLPSRDPTSITTIRTVNWLALSDLLFIDHSRIEFIRLDNKDREKLILLKEVSEETMCEFYKLPTGSDQAKYVRYQPILNHA